MKREEITDRILKAIEGGTLPWRRPWAFLAHQNCFSGKAYQGINQILLSLDIDASPHWGTFMQWKGAGVSVRKGEKATQVVFFSVIEKEDTEGNKRSRPFMRHYCVFHVGQVDDPDGKFKHILEAKIETDYEAAEGIFEKSGADIRIGGNRAFYIPGENYLRLPHSGQFESEEERLATAFHELGHWGDRNILGKELSTDKKSPDYAYGELVAELTACFLCQACGVPNDFDNHESYIASWIRAMKNDTSYIWRASKDASKISDELLKRAGIKHDEEVAVA